MKAPKSEVSRRLSEKLDVSIASANQLIETYQEVILELLEDYDDVKIGNLVTIQRNFVEGYDKRLPSGDTVYVDRHYKLRAVIAEKYKKRYL